MTARRRMRRHQKEEISPMPRRCQGGAVLSVHRAFVVHIGAWGGSRRRRFRGRVEHLSSGRTVQFSSLKGLIAFLDAILDGFAPGGDERSRRQSLVRSDGG